MQLDHRGPAPSGNHPTGGSLPPTTSNLGAWKPGRGSSPMPLESAERKRSQLELVKLLIHGKRWGEMGKSRDRLW
jgi:hypothetical protein